MPVAASETAIYALTPMCPRCQRHLVIPARDGAIRPDGGYEAACTCGWTGMAMRFTRLTYTPMPMPDPAEGAD